MSEHTASARPYVLALLALLVLTAVTTAVAFVDLGAWNSPVALGIAVAKALVVVLVFMHVRGSSRLTVAVIVATLFWLGILIVLTMGDYLTRGYLTFG